jgi:hypothetical protein
MFALALMMLASASADVINVHNGNCNMVCCRGTWSTGVGSLGIVPGATCAPGGDVIYAKHILHPSSDATTHRCYADANHANGCICQCADATADYTTANKYYTPPAL